VVLSQSDIPCELVEEEGRDVGEIVYLEGIVNRRVPHGIKLVESMPRKRTASAEVVVEDIEIDGEMNPPPKVEILARSG